MAVLYPRFLPWLVMVLKQIFSEAMRLVRQVPPLTHALNSVLGLWFDDALGPAPDRGGGNGGYVAVRVGMSTLAFRWE